MPEKRFLYFSHLAKVAGELSSRRAASWRLLYLPAADWLLSLWCYLSDIDVESRAGAIQHVACRIGSDPLAARLAALRPDVHIFGHTHFSWNMQMDGAPVELLMQASRSHKCLPYQPWATDRLMQP